MKKFMYYLMMLNTFVAAIALAVVFIMGNSSLPSIVLALRGALVVTGVVLVVKRYVSWVRRSEITGFYIAEAAIAVFNLIFLSVFFPVDVSFFEYAITGTLITPILNLALVFLHGNVGQFLYIVVGKQLHCILHNDFFYPLFADGFFIAGVSPFVVVAGVVIVRLAAAALAAVTVHLCAAVTAEPVGLQPAV